MSKPHYRIRQDGWIWHTEDKRPAILPVGEHFDAVLRNGALSLNAFVLSWTRIGSQHDIVLWRFPVSETPVSAPHSPSADAVPLADRDFLSADYITVEVL